VELTFTDDVSSGYKLFKSQFITRTIKMIKQSALMLLAIASLGLAACDDKTTTEQTQKSEVGGTTVEKTTTTETTTDGDGNVSKEVETKTTVDPEGMMNKETTVHEQTTDTKETE
jgi:hypothetical protein